LNNNDGVTVSARIVFTDPFHFLAFGFGAGLTDKAPGTAGSVVGVLFGYLTLGLGMPWRIAIAGALIITGIWICEESSKRIGVHDYGGIVWDEITGMYITLLVLPQESTVWAAGFALFRLFDIWKPWPIRDVERNVKGGAGIMVDDILAAIYTVLLLFILGVVIG
tara:strand:- start:138 stop:632 length:495 start_codon:yes stop_codon:yes gene_type:complete